MNLPQGVVDKIANLSPEQAEKIWKELKGSKKKYPQKAMPKTRVQFPITSTITFKTQQPCITWQEALKHLGEVLIQDVDKKSVPTIKGQIVEALAMLAEVAVDEGQKRTILGRANRVIMETDRMKLMNQVASMATMV